MFIPRALAGTLEKMASKFPVVAVTGPRQSGKTTLVQSVFPDRAYVSLEDPDTRERALADPRGLLRDLPEGAILDEVQRAPDLLSYVQGIVDRRRRMGQFILTGSHQLQLMEQVSQTLAGRVRILNLLPFSSGEIAAAGLLPGHPEEALFRGAYPPVYDRDIEPGDWYPSYLQTYVDRDVRAVRNVGDLDTFQRFVRLCAARSGQVLNLSSLANDAGITHPTARAWVSVLQTSFILFLLPPFHRNFNKRLIKAPKLYFHDTGLVASLLGIESAGQLRTHPLRGSIFETFVVSELVKMRLNAGREPRFAFWRDKTGHEVDLAWERGNRLSALEIKSGETVSEDFFKDLRFWSGLAGKDAARTYLVYGGDQGQTRGGTQVLAWRDLPRLAGEL